MILFKALMLVLAVGLAAPVSAATIDETPAQSAIEDFRGRKIRPSVVRNRFFVKKNRFEISPSLGYVPNNPFSRRYVGSLGFGYHFAETVAVIGSFSYSPDLGEEDLKGLTTVLIDRAHNASGTNDAAFQQPLDKITLAASFGVKWAPIYGKINLLGEKVLNFDFYGVAALSLFSVANYAAVYDEENNDPESNDIVRLDPKGNEVRVFGSFGLGTNFFVSPAIALTLDARLHMYIDDKPVYEQGEQAQGSRLVNRFVASVGVSIFVPKMKPRLYDF